MKALKAGSVSEVSTTLCYRMSGAKRKTSGPSEKLVIVTRLDPKYSSPSKFLLTARIGAWPYCLK